MREGTGETMFIIAQLPLADFRPLINGGKGRLSVPDWSSDNLDTGFVRGFGKISARNGSGLGLGGERSFADVNNALRFDRVEFRQQGWNGLLPIALWFRRLYYDGEMAGRFEIGFMVPEDDLLDRFKDQAVEPSLIAQTILSTHVRVQSVDGSTRATTFANCSEALGLAYIASTTRNDALNEFPIAETYGMEVFVGKPTLHIRFPLALQIQTSRDRRYLNDGGDPEFFITSTRGSETRNNVLVQASAHKVQDEPASERVTRLLFAHINAMLFAHSQFVKTGRSIGGFSERNVLRHAVAKMIERFNRFAQIENSVADKEFAEGMRLFAKAYAGRIDELVTKLQELSAEWNKPTTLESCKHYFKGMNDLIATTAAKTMVEAALKLK
jgi:hypothetical protein